jgi:hypothetical protein
MNHPDLNRRQCIIGIGTGGTLLGFTNPTRSAPPIAKDLLEPMLTETLKKHLTPDQIKIVLDDLQRCRAFGEAINRSPVGPEDDPSCAFLADI